MSPTLKKLGLNLCRIVIVLLWAGFHAGVGYCLMLLGESVKVVPDYSPMHLPKN